MATIPSKQQHQIGTEDKLKEYLSPREIGIRQDGNDFKLAFKDDDDGFHIVGEQSDWEEEDSSSPAYIQNKPDLATVATSGSYDDLTDKPTIPAAQVNADWNADSGVAEILNKPFQRTYAEFTGGFRSMEIGKFDLSQASEVDCGANADEIAIDHDNHWVGRDCYYFPVGGMYRVTLSLNVQSTSANSSLVPMDYGVARKDANDEEESLAWEYFTLDNVNQPLESVHMHATVSVESGDCLVPYIHSNDSWYASVSINFVSFEKMGNNPG